ncbi:ribonuclease D [Constrictibacter sp. MBR-5]|jgi:ribonuclease D|uniref:ribonuclease D n=1 Tax=Constrictibacter sp. MBR-5 TaxID=3156467 RepID=UPI00339AC38B
MTLITEQSELEDFCGKLAGADFVTVDTEFMRESTYWPKLCLVQLAGPDSHAAVDPLAPELDLQPVYDLMANQSVLKVFHAARQDIEIFLHQGKVMPRPVFDTQIAAMVCGYGESVGYETLVVSLTGRRVDKMSRFTNWANRPLTPPQLAYALADVTHLRDVYIKLRERLDREGRTAWVEEEDAVLVADGTYDLDPQNAWRRLRPRTDNPRFLAVLQAVAAWREREAQQRNSPRNWVLRDDTLLDIAAQAPKTPEALARSRGLPKGFAEGRHGKALLDAIAEGVAVAPADRPKPAVRVDLPSSLTPVVELLKVLLKMSCDQHGVAPKLVANTADLEAIAMDDNADVPALHGWRREVFGETALAVKHGRVALAIKGRGLEVVPVPGADGGGETA